MGDSVILTKESTVDAPLASHQELCDIDSNL